MKRRRTTKNCEPSGRCLMSELLILPDGRLLVHNMTPVFARLLSRLNPESEEIMSRVTRHPSPPHELPD